MERVGFYPGSFNPWHKGHRDVLNKALEVFDRVYVIFMQNENKELNSTEPMILASKLSHLKNVIVSKGTTTLQQTINSITLEDDTKHLCNKRYAVIRGLRNGHDLQYEMNNQYWNEDLGIQIPFVYFITDRRLAHVSSSAIRGIKKLGLHHDY